LHKSIDIEKVIDITVESAKLDGVEVEREDVREVWDGFITDSREKHGWSPFDYEKPDDVGYDVYIATICKAYSLAEGLNEVGVEAQPLFNDTPDWLDIHHCTPLHAVLGRMAPSLLMAVRDVIMEALRQKLGDWHGTQVDGIGGSLEGYMEGADTVLSRLVTASLASGLDVAVPPNMEGVASSVEDMRDAAKAHAGKDKSSRGPNPAMEAYITSEPQEGEMN